MTLDPKNEVMQKISKIGQKVFTAKNNENFQPSPLVFEFSQKIRDFIKI